MHSWLITLPDACRWPELPAEVVHAVCQALHTRQCQKLKEHTETWKNSYCPHCRKYGLSNEQMQEVLDFMV